MDFTALLVDLVASPWMPLVVLAVCLIDGFFPPVPSETTVVAALAVALAAGEVPQAVVILLAAASGAVAGDSIAYAVGRRVGLERYRWMRRGRVRKVAALMRERVHRSPAMLLLVARYIPVGRVVVNATAGATRLAYRRFLPLSALAGVAWAGMCLAVAGASAAWLGNPLWASLAAIAFMLALGLVLDVIARRRLARAGAGRSRRVPGEGQWLDDPAAAKRRPSAAKASASSGGPTTSTSASNRPIVAASPGHDHAPRNSRHRPSGSSSTTPSPA